MTGRLRGRMSAALVLLALFTAACSGDAQPQLYGSKADLIELQDKARPVGELSSEDAPCPEAP